MSSVGSTTLRLPPALSGLQPYLRPAILALLTLFIAWRLASLTWLLWPKAPASVAVPAAGSVQSGAKQAVNVEALAQLHLFGQMEEAPQQVAAPTTDLALVLRGVWAFPEESGRASAIIEANGEQSVVFVGESMPGGANASLKQVFPDRVILDRGGRLETLALLQDGDASTISLTPVDPGAEAPASQGGTVDKRGDAGLQKRLMQVRKQLASNPMSLLKLMAAKPVRKNGQLLGYALAPAGDPKLFARMGLQAGDVVTAVNGIPLSDPAQLPMLMQQFQSAATLNIAVQRGGGVVSLLLGESGKSNESNQFPVPPPPMPEQVEPVPSPDFNPYQQQGEIQ